MDIIGESWDCANRVRDILLNILDQQLKPRLLSRNGEAGLKASVLSSIPSSTRSDDSDEARSSASPPQDFATIPPTLHSSANPMSRQRLETDMYPSWPTTHIVPQHHPPMTVQAPSALTPTSSTYTTASGPAPLSSHRIQPAQVQNPFITGNPIFSSGAGLDVDMDVNMNFTGMSMDFTMDPLTNAPVPYAAFSMPPNIMDYHPVSTNGSGMPIRVGGGMSRQSGGGHSNTGGSGSAAAAATAPANSTGTSTAGIGFSEEDLAMMDHIVRQHQRSAIVQGQGQSQGQGPNHYRG